MKIKSAGKYFTSFLLLISADPAGIKMSYACAGHPPGILLRPRQKKMYKLDTSGMFVGIDRDTLFGQKDVFLGSGERIILYTDGIPESRNLKNEQYGQDGICRSVMKNQNLGLKDFLNGLISDVSVFSTGTLQGDDITMLVIEIGSD